MGQFLSQPKTDKESFDDGDEASGIRYGVTSMQGWRSGMEDAHLCNLSFDNGRKLFGVFDGHAGPEVAQYLALHLGEFLLKNKAYMACGNDKKLNIKKLGRAMVETFMTVDAHLLSDEAIAELEKLSEHHPERESCDNSDDEQAEARELVSEANMSLPELMAKYGSEAFGGDGEDEEGNDATNGDEPKHNQARKHLLALAQRAGYNIQFGDAEDEEDEDSEAKKVKDSDSKKSSECNGDEAASSNSRRRKAKPSKATAGPVDISPGDEADNTKDSKKTEEKPAADDTKKQKDVAEEESEDDDEEDEEEEDEEDGVNGNGEDDDEEEEEEADDDDEEEDEEDDIDEEDSAVPPGFDENFPQGVGKSSGSTAVAALLCGDQLIVANTGDSRCVLCRGGEAIAMSEDHQPELEEERERIEKAGGIVSGVGRVNNGLNMSRAIGDHGYKMRDDLPADAQMIIAKPDIRTETIGEDDEFMILACDGIWNCMTNQECVKFVRKRLLKRGGATSLSAICEEVCDHCLAPDISGDGSGSDNMTMMVVLLKSEFGVPATRRKKSRASALEEETGETASPARKRTKRAR